MSLRDIFDLWMAAILVVALLVFAIRQLAKLKWRHMTWKDRLAEGTIAVVLGVGIALLIVLMLEVSS